MLVLKELLGGKLKFGLMVVAIGLVVSLTMVTTAMSQGLLTGMSGAKMELAADALAFQADTYPTLERSILSADDIAEIAETPGVKNAYGVGHSFATVSSDEPFDVRIFGLGDHHDQLPIVEGTGDIGPGETVADESAALKGVELGDTVVLTPTDIELKVVGFTEGRRYVMTPTLWVDMPTWEEIHTASVLGRMDAPEADAPGAGRLMAEQFSGSASIAAIELEPDADLQEVIDALGDEYPTAPTEEAALSGNGMTEMIIAVTGIQVVSLVIGALLVGVFFYITTLHKTPQIAAIKAIGASNGRLYADLIAQITVLVALATAFGVLLALGMGAGMPPTMAFDPDPARWGLAVAAVFATAYIGSLFSLRSILKVDPATALGRTSA